MIKKNLLILALSLSLASTWIMTAWADEKTEPSVTMESCGAYIFDWRPVDCGNGHYFAILAGTGNTLSETDVILKRGYDYAYTFDPSQPKPWGQVPDLAFVDGKWGIPENRAAMPEGSYSTLQIVLTTNNHNFTTKERYVDVVKLPDGVSSSSLPNEVKKYLINTDGSDSGASKSVAGAGWEKESDGRYRYRKPDGTYVGSGWLKLDTSMYYMDDNGYMLSDTITPDGFYVNPSGVRQNFIPGWKQNEKGWKYLMKNGNYAATAWIQDVDGKWYYFEMGGYMESNTQTPDGFTLGADGVWDGQPSTIDNRKSLGPGVA